MGSDQNNSKASHYPWVKNYPADIDWDMNIQEAMNAPHLLHRGKKLEVEMSGVEYAKPLKDLGHPVLVGDMNSGLTAIQFKEGKIIGAVDSRRDGFAIGN